MFKKIWIFFDRVQWTHLTMVPKMTPMGLLSYVQNKNKFHQKSIRIALPTMILTSKMICHEDRFSFPVYGEKINLGHFSPFLRLAVLKVQNFCQN
jgi:hypothetical protein